MVNNEFHRDRLDNGLRVITVEMPHLHSVEMACYVGVGSRHEAEEVAGISHFLEHMLFRGTADHPTSLDLERAFEVIGGAVNAVTDAETTCYHSRLHPRHIREGAALFASMLRRPLLQDLEVERRIILEEALEDYDEFGREINPDSLTGPLLWPGHPLSRPTIGNREAIAAISEEALRRHHRLYYVPNQTVIVLAGQVRRDEVLAAISAVFGDWLGDAPPPPLPVGAPAAGEKAQAQWLRHSDSQVNVQMAFRMPGRRDPRMVALRVLRRVLSGSGSSRLMLRLREALGLTYSVEANMAAFADSGCFTVDLAVSPASLLPVVAELLAIFEDLLREPVGTDELQGVVRTFLYDLDFGLDHPEEMAMRFGWGEMTDCLRTLEEDRREVSALTPALLLDTVRELFTPGALKLAVVGPFQRGDRRQVETLLKGFRKEGAKKG
jgi:predicted Zn-dependent peptidase